MGLFNLFSRDTKKAESVVLIDIGAGSVAGAYARYEDSGIPTLIYTHRIPIEMHEGEAHELAMLRTLEKLGGELVRDGAPALLRAVGSGSANLVLVSVDAPWQETTIRSEQFDTEESFLFTRSLVVKRLDETRVTPSERMLADESIIGTILNGYETANPYGKRAHRASVVVLTSFIEKGVAHGIIKVLRAAFHTKRILPIAGNSLRYQAMRAVFPHEENAFILDATSSSLTSVSLVRRGIFVTMAHIAGSPLDPTWVERLTHELADIATRYPLPRTIFLLTREPDTVSVRQVLAGANLGKLWLSDNPPTIVPVLGSQLADSVRQATTEPADVILILMAIYYYQAREKEEKF